MKIAIIGAGVAGLTAGRELMKAGHEVVVFEKSRGYGGRMATRYAGKDNATKLDHGLPYIELTSPELEPFIKELGEKGIIQPWIGPFARYTSTGNIRELRPSKKRFIAPGGMNKVGQYLGRFVDVRTETKVGGLTHIGEDRKKKRSWMLNFSSGATESADAVIIATPSKQAYAVLNTTIDEVATLKIIREIDEVEYYPSFSLLAGYGNTDVPEWAMMECKDHPVIESITNEATKRDNGQEASYVIHTTPDFAERNENTDPKKTEEAILDALSDIMGGWAAVPQWSQLHYWRYSRVKNPLPYPFMEVVGNDAPVAVIGGYMNGDTLEAAYLSGKAIGEYWKKKFRD